MSVVPNFEIGRKIQKFTNYILFFITDEQSRLESQIFYFISKSKILRHYFHPYLFHKIQYFFMCIDYLPHPIILFILSSCSKCPAFINPFMININKRLIFWIMFSNNSKIKFRSNFMLLKDIIMIFVLISCFSSTEQSINKRKVESRIMKNTRLI